MSNFKRNLLIALVIVAFLLGCWAFIFTKLYGNQVQNRILDELNENLLTEVIINGPVKLSVFKYFPKVSLAIHDIEVRESIPESDSSVLKADRIYFVMNVWDVIMQDWKIQRTVIENGELVLKRDKNGVINYKLTEPSKNKTEKSTFLIDIEKAQLQNVDFRYMDEIGEVYLNFHIPEASLAGNFSPKKLLIQTQAEVFSNRLEIKGIDYASQKEISINGGIKINPENDSYELHVNKFLAENNQFEINGKIIAPGNTTFFDLTITGKNLSLGDFPKLLPAQATAKLADLKGNGTVQLQSQVKGNLDKKRSPLITISADVTNANIQYNHLTRNMEKLSFHAYYTNGARQNLETSELSFKKINGVVAGKAIEGDVTINNLNEPHAKIDLDGWVDLSMFNSLVSKNGENPLSGNVLVKQLSYNGTIKELTAPSFQKQPDLKGELEFVDAGYFEGNSGFKVNSGKINLNSNKVALKDMTMVIADNELVVNGEMENPYSYIYSFIEIPSSVIPSLWVRLQVNTEKLDVKKLTGMFTGLEENGQQKNSMELQKRFNVNGNVDLATNFISYGKFAAYDVSGNVIFKPGVVTLKDFSLNTMDGVIDLNSTAQIKGNDWSATTSVQCHDINIKELFYQMDNFDQDVLTDKNLKGKLTSDIKLASAFSNGTIDMNSLSAKADITIKDGELTDFKPLEKLSGFINIEELKKVRFSTLTNQIEIEKRVIYIPEMIVKSNALNLSISGMHTLDNLVDYQIKINIFDVLANKFKRRKRDNAVYEEVNDNNFNFYVSMTGKIDNPEIKFQKLSPRTKINDRLVPVTQESKSKQAAPESPHWEKDDELEFIEWNDTLGQD